MIPNFNTPAETGQLWNEEREALYNHVVETKPEKVFEIGTWRGHGSTYFITSAMETNKCGHLWTTEISEESYTIAKNFYSPGNELSMLEPFVSFHLGSSLNVFPSLLKEHGPIDMVFVDGGFDNDLASAEVQLQEIWMLRPHIKVGGFLVIHDWGIGKCILSQPAMAADDVFCFERIVTSLVFFKKVKEYQPETRIKMS